MEVPEGRHAGADALVWLTVLFDNVEFPVTALAGGMALNVLLPKGPGS